jgi:hypothetical protein
MSNVGKKENGTESEFIERFENKAITAFIFQSSSRRRRQRKKAVVIRLEYYNAI